MNAAQAFSQTPTVDADLLPQNIAELRPYVGVADREEIDLSSQVKEVFKRISGLAESLVLTALEKSTATEFTAAAMSLFSQYVRMLRVKSDFLQVILKGDLQANEQIVNRSLNGIEFSFKDHGAKQFGSTLTEQAEFTIWTRRKTANLIWKLFEPGVSDHTLSPEAVEQGNQLYAGFALASAWSQFHLECLTTAMHLKRAIYPDVVPAIVEGLRSEVNAYALAKRMVDLYLPPAPEESLEPYAWRDEDDDLLAESMQDMASEQLEKY